MEIGDIVTVTLEGEHIEALVVGVFPDHIMIRIGEGATQRVTVMPLGTVTTTGGGTDEGPTE